MIETLLVAGVTGAISTVATVISLRVHISYLRESITRIEQATTRAHVRIDHIEKHGAKAA